MKFDKVHPSRNTTWGVLAGVAISIVLLLWLQNKILAPVMGTLFAILVAGPTQIRDFGMLGGTVGVITGPAIGIVQYLFSGKTPVSHHLPTLLLFVLGGLILNGCLCAAYGFLTGIVVHLYRKGQGPFF